MAKIHNFAKNRKPILLINFLTLARLNQTWERVWYDYGKLIFRQGPLEVAKGLSRNRFFVIIKSITYKRKIQKNRIKQRLFLDNALPRTQGLLCS